MVGSADAFLMVLDAEHLLSCQSSSSQECIEVCGGLLVYACLGKIQTVLGSLV